MNYQGARLSHSQAPSTGAKDLRPSAPRSRRAWKQEALQRLQRTSVNRCDQQEWITLPLFWASATCNSFTSWMLLRSFWTQVGTTIFECCQLNRVHRSTRPVHREAAVSESALCHAARLNVEAQEGSFLCCITCQTTWKNASQTFAIKSSRDAVVSNTSTQEYLRISKIHN